METEKGFETRLEFIEEHHIKEVKRSRNKGASFIIERVIYSLYKCSCGKLKVILQRNVTEGKTRSCGCLRRDVNSKMMKQLNVDGKGHKKGTKPSDKRKGQEAHNKDKILIKDNPPGEKFITFERLTAMYYGMDGEVHSLRKRNAPNRGKTLVNGRYV